MFSHSDQSYQEARVKILRQQVNQRMQEQLKGFSFAQRRIIDNFSRAECSQVSQEVKRYCQKDRDTGEKMSQIASVLNRCPAPQPSSMATVPSRSSSERSKKDRKNQRKKGDSSSDDSSSSADDNLVVKKKSTGAQPVTEAANAQEKLKEESSESSSDSSSEASIKAAKDNKKPQKAEIPKAKPVEKPNKKGDEDEDWVVSEAPAKPAPVLAKKESPKAVSDIPKEQLDVKASQIVKPPTKKPIITLSDDEEDLLPKKSSPTEEEAK